MNNIDRAIDVIPMLDRSIALNYSETMLPEEKINYLVQRLRLTIHNHKQLFDITGSSPLDYKQYPFKKNSYDIKEESLSGEGAAIVDLLRRLNWEKEGISFEKYDIKQLSNFFQSQEELKNKLSQNTHSISIVTIEDKKYIVDCAYRQFFSSQDGEGNLGRIDLSELCFKDTQNREVAEQILKYGWIEASPENMKRYLDMFLADIARDENIDFPTQQDYMENFKGQIITGDVPVMRMTGGYNINDALADYYMNKRSKEENEEKREYYRKVRNLLKEKERSFSITRENDGKQYIKGNFDSEGEDKDLDNRLRHQIHMMFEKARIGNLQYTEKNLKMYLDGLIVLLSGDRCIERPTIEEYDEIFKKSILEKSGPMETRYIVDSQPNIIDGFDTSKFSEDMTVEEILTNIVQRERQFLMRGREIVSESLIGDCEDSTARVSLDCASKGFTNTNYLSPGIYLDGRVKGHNCTVATLGDKSYLIDCTYRQFFTKINGKNNPRNIYDG